MTPLLAQLEDLAQRAGRIALSFYGRVAAERKQDLTLVSRADREVEAFLRRELGRLAPDVPFIGEESAADPEVVGRARAAERVWVVDPIDGTTAYLGQLDTFCVCVAELRGGRPHLGVVHLPALDQTYLAERGGGALWRNPRGDVALDGTRPPAKVACLLCPSNVHRDYRVSFEGKVRSLGSTALHYALVARGLGLGAFARSHVWDWAAAAAVLEEAGGVMRRLDGRDVDWRELLDGRREEVPVLGAWPDGWDELARQVALR